MKHSGKLLILAIALVGSITVNAQVKQSKNNGPYTYHAETTRVGMWSDRDDEYTWEDWKHNDVDITIDGSTVTFGNKSQTKLKIKEEVEKEHYNSEYENMTTLWNAIDQDGKKCKFRMMFYDTGNVGMMIFYNDIVVQFQESVDSDELDNFKDN